MTPKRVLVVDDERQLVDAICDYLATDGWTCAGAGTAGEALALLDAEGFDVVLTDISLTGEDDTAGLELAAHVHAMGIPALVMTGHEAARYADAASHAGARFLRKPIALAELARELARLTT